MVVKGTHGLPGSTMMHLARYCLIVILFYADSSWAYKKCQFGAKEKLCKLCCATDCCASAILTPSSPVLFHDSEVTGGNVFGTHGPIILVVVGLWIAFIAVFSIFTVCFCSYKRKKSLNDGGEYTLMTEAPVVVQIEYGNPLSEEEIKKEEGFNQSHP